MIRALVVDDQDIVRQGISLMLSLQDDIEVVGEARDGARALECVRELQPDVVVMDVQMPGTDGVEATKAIIAAGLGGENVVAKILILTSFSDPDLVLAALRAGARGFLLKSSPPERLLGAIRALVSEGYFIDPSVAGHVIQEVHASSPVQVSNSALDRLLTPRERDTLILIAQGLNNEEIAERLVLSPATVKTHVSQVLEKTRSRDRLAAALLAYRFGLVRLPLS